MDPLADFTNADLVNFMLANATFHVNVTKGLITYIDYTQPVSSPPAACAPKPAPSLGLVVTAAEIGFKYPLVFDFAGVAAGISSEAIPRPLVHLSINKEVNVLLKNVNGHDVTVNSVSGSLTLALSSLTQPVDGGSCGGTCHPFVVQFDSYGDGNQLKAAITAHDVTPGIDADGTATLTIPSVDAAADSGLRGLAAPKTGIDSQASVAIWGSADECGIFAVAGTHAQFYAITQGVDPGVNLSYTWSVSGTVPAPKPSWAPGWNGPTFIVIAPDPPGDFAVTVSVTVAGSGCTVSDRKVFRSISGTLAWLLGELCELRTAEHFPRTPIFPFPGPGPDPLRIRQISSDNKLRAMQRMIERAGRLIGELLNARRSLR